MQPFQKGHSHGLASDVPRSSATTWAASKAQGAASASEHVKGAAAFSAAAAEAMDTEGASQAAKEASVVLAKICKLIFSCLVIHE